MKSKYVKTTALAMAILSAVTLSSCSATENYDASDYVTLGNYKNVEVTISGDYSTGVSSLDDYVASMIADTQPYIPDDSQTTVAKDSVVNVDYVGKKDGVAFDGGSAKDVLIDVGKNMEVKQQTSYISGFTDGLVGATVGSTVDSKVTFPSDYSSAELAGKEVTFTFTVNYIGKQMTKNDLTDDYVSKYFGQSNVSAFMDYARQQKEAKVTSTKNTDIRKAVIDKVVSNAKIKGYPRGVVSERVDDYIDRYEASYCTDTTLKEYLSTNYGASVADFEKEVKKTVEDNLDQQLVFATIAKKEGIKLDEDGFNTYCKSLMNQYSYTTTDKLYEAYGKNAKVGKKSLEQNYVCNKACDLCVKGAKVKESAAKE